MQEVIRSQLGYSKSKVMPLLTCCFSLIKMEFSGPLKQPLTFYSVPKRVVEYPPTTVLSLVSKDIIVRSVYFDDRPRDGHQNALVFMVEARRGLIDQNFVHGCQIGKYFGKDTKVR